MKKALLWAALAWVLSCSYCYSDIVTGQSNNAAASGLRWDMTTALPGEAGLKIEGVYHKYTIEKNAEANASVIIRNEDAIENGYVYERTDNWDGLPGNTKIGYDPLVGGIPATKFGDGEIVVEGDGTITDATILYTYKYDTCYNPIGDPSCPGYENALYQYLIDNNLLNEPNYEDPYYNEYVQNALDQETDTDEETESEQTEEQEEEKEERSMEDMLAISGAVEDLADAAQQAAMLAQLSNAPMMNQYYDVTISGGVYTDKLKFEDKDIQDNRKAMRNLAQQKKHQDMVRSQYD